MVEILYRVKEHGRIVGYWAREAVHGSEIWIPIQDVGRYKATNAKLDANGNMVSHGLVKDQTGNIYSLETNHNGYYGMLRHTSGNYDGVYLDIEQSHDGAFGKIKNADGINALQSKYGLAVVDINNSNCYYTSTFKGSQGQSGSPVAPSGEIQNNTGQTGSNNNPFGAAPNMGRPTGVNEDLARELDLH